MRKLAIVHFQEIEKYPPTINLLRYLGENTDKKLRIEVFTTIRPSPFTATIPGIKIHRLARWKKNLTKVGRLLLYCRFNLLAIIKLIRFSPDVLLYFETLSAGPPWFFKTFIKRKAEIYIHYHEYVSKREYDNGMRLSRCLHNKEKELYPHTAWVSHTNADRLSLFLKDVLNHTPQFTYLLPNYPPASWKNAEGGKKDHRIGFVYVGALSLETMYLPEMADFVKSRQNECYWDIYSTNISEEVLSFFQSQANSNINFKGGVAYDDLPGILSTYDIGLILYKGHIPNYVYNTPNKLFEYHVCGLDVWFPTSMKSSMEYVTKDIYPKIMAVDFENLDKLDLDQAADRSDLTWTQHDYFCEDVFNPLVEKLTRNNGE